MQIRKNKNGVNIQILKIFQKLTLTCMCYVAGEMERLQKFWLAGACSQKTEEGESSQPLGILNFTSAFILLAGGMLLGGLLLLLEHIYFKFFRRKLRKWDRCGCCGLVSLVCICIRHDWERFSYFDRVTCYSLHSLSAEPKSDGGMKCHTPHQMDM